VPPLGDRFRVVQNAEMGEVADSVFLAGVHDRELRHLRRDGWPTSEKRLDGLGEPLLVESAEGHSGGVWEVAGVLVRASLGGGWLHMRLAGADAAAVTSALADLRRLFPAPDPSSTREVPVTFWTYTPHGPMPAPRTIAVPEWDEIGGNYAARTREQLDAVMRDFRPAHGGQLVLWHGTPGTGKTFALRALAWEWREWCQLHYVVDPDTFFGERADYLMGVLMQPAGRMGIHVVGGGWTGYARTHAIFQHHVDGDEEAEIDENGGGRPPKHWRLLVLEDTGELLTPDAKSIIGQGLSRFLNVVDGLIGQGLRILVLVTTNEEIKSLHPAVSRPGRCAADIEFGPLSPEEAEIWLTARGIDGEPAESRLLASLYAAAEGFDPSRPRASAGFAEG
jgi:hypothetical protein